MRYLRILLGICLLVTLAGCLGALSPDDTTPTAEPTPLPTATPGQTPTATSTPTPTATATPEPTPLPTPTPTQTPTPTATPTPEPQNKVGTINEWVETRHNGTRMRIKMADYFTTDEIEKSDGGTRSPDEGNTYLVAEVFVTSSFGGPVTIGRSQWSYTDITGTTYSPANAATDDVADSYPAEMTLQNDGIQRKIVFEVQYYNDVTFRIVPYGSQSGGTVTFEGS